MRRSLLTVFLLGAAAVALLGLWQAAGLTEGWASLAAKSKAMLKTFQATLIEEPTNVARSDAGDEHRDHESNGHSHKKAALGDEHGEEGSSEHHDVVELKPAQLADFGIQLAVAGEGSIADRLERPAEVKFNDDKVVHVVPRVEGVATGVEVAQGERVAKGAVMAVLDSRELAELKATYLAAFERRNLARETFERERRLWEKKISSEKDYLDAKTALVEAEIAVRASGQKLKAIGVSDEFLSKLTTITDADLTKYNIVAPLSGIIVERHVSLGEAVSTDKEAFVVADTSTVWVEVTIYPQDLSLVRAGQRVLIDIGDAQPIRGEIAFVTPHVREETRTAVARVITDSAGGRLKPGMFVKAQIEVGAKLAGILVPKSAIQNHEDRPVVFVQEEENKFEPRPVKTGREDSQFVEILSGVSAGERYVSKGAFTLKAQLSKASFGDGHSH